MRYSISWLLLLGFAAPAFVTAASDPATTAPATATTDAAPATTDVAAPTTDASAPKADSPTPAASPDVKPELGLEAAPAAADESASADSTEEAKPKKKKRGKKVASKHHRKQHHAPTHKSCGGAVDEAYKSQNSMYVNKDCIPTPVVVPATITCEPASSCGTSAQ